MEENQSLKRALSVLAIVFAIIVAAVFVYMLIYPASDPVRVFRRPFSRIAPASDEVKQFASDEEFNEYIAESRQSMGYYGGLGAPRMEVAELSRESVVGMDKALAVGLGSGEAPSRVSQTNVQVFNIDEPDIVKTDGNEIYFSSPGDWFEPRGIIIEPMLFEESSKDVDSMRIERKRGGTYLIDAFPPADLEVDDIIGEQGDLLLSDDNLVIFKYDEIVGFDVSDSERAREKWSMTLGENTSVASTRLYNDEIYLITQTHIYSDSPCPIRPLILKESSGKNEIVVPCTDIYYPGRPISADSTYTIMKVDPATGEVMDRVSFIGSYSSAVIYMSTESIYLTYYHPGDFFNFFVGFVSENSDLFPGPLASQLVKVNEYDISDSSKMTELMILMEQWQNSLDDDDQLMIENELENRMADYHQENMRDLEKTGIVKIMVDDLEVSGTGSVPGTLLNQFSLDEYDGYLRVATTVGSNSWMGGLGSFGESESDVYVLDEDLLIEGSAKGMGVDEKIYSVRFIGDKGYVVTFRQIDPFYVLDLSNPERPEIKGELKIPGYSSYLHPISEDKILGIGKEDSNVKISLFDVSDPSNPEEVSKYELDEYWTDILSTHHAFLMDDKYEVFFMPGGRGGYIFSYADDDLRLVDAVAQSGVRRALYLNDYLYIISDSEIIVLNEEDWEEVNTLELE